MPVLFDFDQRRAIVVHTTEIYDLFPVPVIKYSTFAFCTGPYILISLASIGGRFPYLHLDSLNEEGF